MDEKLKHRLVGASVIVALAVFFLPMILDSEKYRSQIQSQIPPVPGISQTKSADVTLTKEEDGRVSSTDPLESGPLVINLDEKEQLDNKKLNVNSNSASKESTQTVKTEPSPTPTVVPVESSQPATNTVANDKAEVTEKEQPEQIAQKPVVNKQVSKVKEQAKSKAKVEPAKSTEKELAFSESAWLIQIGSFSNKENATRLVKQLRDKGYRAYQRVGESYARVYVGPYPIKAEADKRISALEKLVGSKVKVIEFDPKQH